MKKPLQPHLLKRVPPACKGERTMKWRGRPPIGGQDSDRVSHRCFAPYTLLPLRGISPQGETRNLRRKTESHILHVPLRHSPFGGWRHMNKPLCGLRVDGPLGRRFLRGLSLTRLWREGCGGAYELIEGASLYKTFTTGLSSVGKPYNRPAGVGNACPLWWLTPPPFPRTRGHSGCLAMESCLCRKA